MKLSVPEQLKVLLVDDWEAVTKNNQVRIRCIGSLFLATRTLTLGYDLSSLVYQGNRTWLNC